MSQELVNKLSKIPIVSFFVKLLHKIKLPGFNGLSLFDLLEIYGVGIAKGALSMRASAIAYSFFMALFPFLLFFIVLIPVIPIDGFKEEFVIFLDSFLPANTSDFLQENIFEKISGGGGVLSMVFLGSIFLMANGVNAVFSGFENSYHKQLTRNVIKQYLYALGVALILACLVIITVALFIYFELYVIENVSDAYSKLKQEDYKGTTMWTNIFRNVFFVLMLYLSTAILYFFGTKEGRQSRFFSWGALLTTLLIVLTSYLFGLYINNFGQYNKLYGSIGALLILMLYLWLNANILLLGFELNISLNQLRKKHNNEE